MNTAAANDLHFPPEPSSAALPHSMEAERALLGCILYDNEAFHRLDGRLQPRHLYEPLHARLIGLMGELIGKGMLAEPVIVRDRMQGDAAFVEFGGMRFLADLLDDAPPAHQAQHFADIVVDTAMRRDLMRLANDLLAEAKTDTKVTDLVGGAETALLALHAGGRETKLVSAGAASASVLSALDAPATEADGILTGIKALDDHCGAFLPGELVLLMGRPSMGKSAAAECIGLNMARGGAGVIQVNGEMTPEMMARRHQTDLCFDQWGTKGPEYRDIRRRRIGATERDMLQWAHEQIAPLPLMMLKRPGLKLAQLRSIARRQGVEWARAGIPFGALMVDHVGLLRTDQRMDRYEAQTEISNGLKELADELDCVIFGLNQMNRQNEHRDDKRPQLSDLRDSGSWEQDADWVIGWYREAYYAQREAEPKDGGKRGGKSDLTWDEWDRRRKSKTIEAIVLKAREGETGTVELWGDVGRNAIRSVEPSNYGGFV